MSSPVFSGANSAFKPGATINPDGSTVSATELDQHFNAPSATPLETGRMTYEGVISKTSAMIILAFLLAAPGYMFFSFAGLMISGLVGMVLGLVLAFKKTTPPALAIAYAGIEGYFLGSLSNYVETYFNAPGAGLQALLATGVTFAVCLTLYRTGKVRYTPKMQKFLIIGGISYLAFSLVNLGLMLFGATDSPWGVRSEIEILGLPLGVFIGAFAIILACVSLIGDFDFIENGVKRGLPARYEWTAAFGLVVTLVWMYTEFLRIIALLQGRD
ncbi:Bax inhibitor-1/YccA family protein [Demequina sediminicola]|uniref:Bax inhibitor-1/YccA family protein n=1 Tax=Demequina sediminicola TaxID=1095026 RepID=UPI0007807DA2|nr:Bax inhibitor-1/YccA family protein [Demequina sediminicola]